MPVAASVVVLSLGIGIGVNTVVFSWIQARLLRPIPGVTSGISYQLVEPKTDAGLYPGASWQEFGDLRGRLQSFRELLAWRIVPLYVGQSGQVERVFGVLVSDNYFSALGLQPVLGRFPGADDTRRDTLTAAAVISYGMWQSRYDGATTAIGRTVRVNGRELTIIGVTPAEFQGTVLGLNFDIWVPATQAPLVANNSRELDDRRIRGYSIMGRLQAGASRAQAQSELDATMRQLAQAYPETNAAVLGEVLPLTNSPRGPQRMLTNALVILQAVMLLLLLAVCANTANLMLARASTRQREMGIRLALGASGWRIASLFLTENVLLGLAGASLGAGIAVWGTQGLLELPLTGLPIRFQTSIDALGLSFAMALGVGCGAIFGAAPALQLARVDPQLAFRAGLRTASRSRLRNTVMAVQVALALMVLVVAGLFFRSFMETRDTDPGFRRDGVLLAAYDLSGRTTDQAFNRTLARRLIETTRALPGVEGAAIASAIPLDIHGLPTRVFTLEGRTRTDEGFDEAVSNAVSPGYFDVMGIPFRAGQDFAPLDDTAAPPQAIVNEEFVRRYVGDGEPLGRRLQARGRQYVITGVVRNSLSNAFGEPPTPAIYFSYRDGAQPRGEIHVRTRAGSETAVTPELRRAVRDLDPDLPLVQRPDDDRSRRDQPDLPPRAGENVRGARAAAPGAGRDRHLRGRRLHRLPAPVGDRRTPRARLVGRPRRRPLRRRHAQRHRHRRHRRMGHRLRRRPRLRPGRHHRHPGVRRCPRAAAGGLRLRQLAARPPRQPHRSDGRAQGVIARSVLRDVGDRGSVRVTCSLTVLPASRFPLPDHDHDHRLPHS